MRVSAKLPWLIAGAVLTHANAGADSMTVPSVGLREDAVGRYILEVRTVPALVSGIRSPVAPARCDVGAVEREEEDERILLRYTIDCHQEPLDREDVVVLPWIVDGIQLTAQWLDGTSGRVILGREPAGVIIRIRQITDYEETLADLASQHGAAGLKHAFREWSHGLFILALLLVGRTLWIGLGGLVAGHALSLIVAEAGVVGLPLAPADAVIAGAAALLAAGVLKSDTRRSGLLGVAVVLGALHGLGTASALDQAGTPTSRLVSSLFVWNVGLDFGNALLSGGLLVAWKLGAPTLQRRRMALAGFVGAAGIFVLLGTMRAALSSMPPVRAESGLAELDASSSSPLSEKPFVPSNQTDALGKLASAFMSYLVVEPYQVRHEVLVDVSSIRPWIDVVVDASSKIPLEAQRTLSDAVSALVVEHSVVAIDGQRVRAASTSAAFVAMGPTGASTRSSPVPEPIDEAVVGVTLVYETADIADSVEIEWNLFSDEIATMPLTLTDPSGVTETELSPNQPEFQWRNALVEYEIPEIEPVSAATARMPLLSLVLVLVACTFFRRRGLATLCLFCAYVAYPFARTEASVSFAGTPRIDRVEASELVDALLTNVYRSFDIHNEERIYDRLALSVTGDPLLDVYLESRRALELENRGGASVRIDEVVVQDIRAIRDSDGGGYEIDTVWTVGGSVNHFGHIHFRQNRYEATITVIPEDGAWKIRELELLTEDRLL